MEPKREYRRVPKQFNPMAVCARCDRDATQTRMSRLCVFAVQPHSDFLCDECHEKETMMEVVANSADLLDDRPATTNPFDDHKTANLIDKPRPWGRPLTYPLAHLAIGEAATLSAPTSADVKRICSNVSQYGRRHDRAYRCKTDRQTRVMTITRVR